MCCQPPNQLKRVNFFKKCPQQRVFRDGVATTSSSRIKNGLPAAPQHCWPFDPVSWAEAKSFNPALSSGLIRRANSRYVCPGGRWGAYTSLQSAGSKAVAPSHTEVDAFLLRILLFEGLLRWNSLRPGCSIRARSDISDAYHLAVDHVGVAIR